MKSEVLSQKEEFLQKADRILSVIKNINRRGGIITQLQMAAACMELQYFDFYLQDKYIEKVVDRNDFPDLPQLEEYIRWIKDVEQDLCDDLYGKHLNPKQREEDVKTISYLEEDVFLNNEQLRQYEEDYLDSWKEIKTDINMLSAIFNCLLRIVVSEFDSIYNEIRKQEAETSANVTSQKKHETKNNFREYIIDKERTEKIIEKLHRRMGNKKDKPAIMIIVEAMWIGWIDRINRPSAPSVKEEFRNITCSESYINRILKMGEELPKKGMKVDEEKLNNIRKEFEQA